MNENAAMYREDAEKLARQIEDEDPMVEVLGVNVDPEVGGYVISIYDRRTGEEYTVDHYHAWTDKRREITEQHIPGLIVQKVYKRHGKRIAMMRGEWSAVPSDRWPEHMRAEIDAGETPGDPIVDIEPSLLDLDAIEPGHGRPEDYGYDGSFLVLKDEKSTKVWKRIRKLANLTLTDQRKAVGLWRELGFDIAPEPRGPMIEPGADDWNEEGILEEVKDRLIDIADQGFEAVLLDGPTNAMAYAWVLAGIMGLEVITSWARRDVGGRSGFTSLGYTRMLHFRDVERSL